MEVLEAIWGSLRLLLAISILVFVLYCCYIKSVHMKYDHIPSAPRQSFFLGHLPIMWRMIKAKEPVYNLFLQWAEEYGPILRFNTFHRVTLLVLSPEGVKEFLMLPQYPKDRITYGRLCNMFGVRFFGNGLVTDCDYDHWHKQRRIMDPAFSRTYLMGLMGTFNDQAEELMKKLEEKADGRTEVNVMSLLRRVTLDIIAKVAFGLELNTLHNELTPFPHAVSTIMEGLGEARNPLFEYMPWNRKVVKDVQESLKLLRRTGKECLERRHKAMEIGEEIPLDILTQILKGAALEEDCDDESLLDNFVTFFFAGHETTANQLSFTIMELGRHSNITMKFLKKSCDYIHQPQAPYDGQERNTLLKGSAFQQTPLYFSVHMPWDAWRGFSRMLWSSILIGLAKTNQGHTFPISHFLWGLVPVLGRYLHRWKQKW
ncbi:cholesterol 24-hydroxylase isoform X2 [Rhineura floridana]|uniref:cholesterol 24-hydroxylase isoform X2 n=1 Tax=Rhineura floridana TaxID=261503 RepID=UPI002AC7EDF9|nr:cholesterol 24-hydroxylase isoform X2 [Rhineura floridana]